jgi:hypothetical protein
MTRRGRRSMAAMAILDTGEPFAADVPLRR